MIKDIGITTSCGTPALGETSCNWDGFLFGYIANIQNVQATGFLSGLVWNSTAGHTQCLYCTSFYPPSSKTYTL